MNLKRTLISLAIFGFTVFVIIAFSNFWKDKMRRSCITRFGNVNTALGLYRADYDGFSPAYTDKEFSHNVNKLERYSGGANLNCPYESSLQTAEFRLIPKVGKPVHGSTVVSPILFPIGTDDTSVIARCIHHVQYRRLPPFLGSDGSKPPVNGFYNVLLRGGSAKSIPFSEKRVGWSCLETECVIDRDRPQTWLSTSWFQSFDFEPKPPRFEY